MAVNGSLLLACQIPCKHQGKPGPNFPFPHLHAERLDGRKALNAHLVAHALARADAVHVRHQDVLVAFVLLCGRGFLGHPESRTLRANRNKLG